LLTTLQTGEDILQLTHFTYPVTAAAWAPNGETFVVGSQDPEAALEVYNVVNDDANLRPVYRWKEEGTLRVYDLALSPDGQRLVVLDKRRILIFDWVSREKVADYDLDHTLHPQKGLTSIEISSDSKYMLVSMHDHVIKLMVIDTGEVVRTFEGHKSSTYMIRAGFGGANENFIVSGSEGLYNCLPVINVLLTKVTLDSRIYIWRSNGALVEALEAHRPGCVNTVAWHPTNPNLFASAGDDHKVRMSVHPPSLSPYVPH